MKIIIHQNEAAAESQLGGKAKALAALQHCGLNIPAWFVVTPEAFELSLTPAQVAAFSAAQNEAELHQVIANIAPRKEVKHAIAQALPVSFATGELLAVRSSAVDEDGQTHSFAGQLDSFLLVAPEEVVQKVVAVWQSGFSERLLAYRREHGLSLLPKPPAVLIQRMINAEAAGVAFAADPITGRRNVAVVSCVQGIGASLVSGECNADTYQVNRAGETIERQLSGSAPVLCDEEIVRIADLVRATSQHFQRPQDIEWAMEKGQLYLLQSRPITTLADLADPAGALNLWDNSNIAESYGGVTTPLTFSFARRAYEEVYRQFCHILRVPAATIQQHDQTYKHMLGLIRGRVYYNLLNWYRVLAMLPGFKLNRRFMEQMMGVKEGLPAHLESELAMPSNSEKLRDGLNLLRMIGGLWRNHFCLPKTIAAFYSRLNEALQEPVPSLSEMRADELAAYYRKLESQLLTRWDAPLINDFFAMVFYGVLRRLAETWCGKANANLHNDLLCGEGGIISAEPARQLRAMAASIKDDSALIEILCAGSLAEIHRQLDSHADLRFQISHYLHQFGDRCLDELKLESATLHDQPLPLFRSIGQIAKRLQAGQTEVVHQEITLRRQAEAKVSAVLTKTDVKPTTS